MVYVGASDSPSSRSSTPAKEVGYATTACVLDIPETDNQVKVSFANTTLTTTRTPMRSQPMAQRAPIGARCQIVVHEFL